MTKNFSIDKSFTGIKVKNFTFYYDVTIDNEVCSVQVHVEVVDKKVNIKRIYSDDYKVTNEDKEMITKDFFENIENTEINFPEYIFFDCSNKNLINEKGYLKDFNGGDWYPHEIVQ